MESSNQNGNFSRVLLQKDVLALAFGGMIGFGWVVLAGTWIREAGSLGAIVAFVIGGIMVGFVGLTYSELVSAMPKAGGEHNYAWRALGARAAFVTSWAIALGYISVVAFEAVALPTVVESLFPGYKRGYLWTVADWDVYFTWVLVGIAGAVVITGLNYVGIKPAAVFQLIASLFLAGVGLLLIFGSFVGGSATSMQPLFANGLAGILSVVIMTPFMFVGFDVIPQSAEEINLPYRRVGTLLIAGVVLVAVFYILVILGVGLSLDRTALGETDLATADAMAAAFNSGFFSDLLLLGGIAGILTSWNALLVGGSRILYAMAESGMLPAPLARIHPRYRTPTNAILLIGFLSLLSPWFGRSALVWLVNAGGLNIVIAYLMVAISFLVLRRSEPDMPRPFRAGKGPVVGVVAVLLSLGIAVQYLPGMPAGLIWPYEWAFVLVWWIAGLLLMGRMRVHEYSPEA